MEKDMQNKIDVVVDELSFAAESGLVDYLSENLSDRWNRKEIAAVAGMGDYIPGYDDGEEPKH